MENGYWEIPNSRLGWLEPLNQCYGCQGSPVLVSTNLQVSLSKRTHLRLPVDIGKTILSYIVWNYLVSESRITDVVTFAVFLSDRSRGIHSAVSVLRTIAYYLLNSDETLLPLFAELQESLRRTQGARTRDSIEQLIERLISASSVKKICVIVDGIDEIGNDERGALLSFLLHLTTTHGKSFNLLASGREEWDIKRKLSSYPKIVVNENNSRDIEKYVEMCQDDLLCQFYPHLGREEISTILKPLPLRSDGTS